VKELFDVGNLTATYGSQGALPGSWQAADSEVVRRLRRAGAVHRRADKIRHEFRPGGITTQQSSGNRDPPIRGIRASSVAVFERRGSAVGSGSFRPLVAKRTPERRSARRVSEGPPGKTTLRAYRTECPARRIAPLVAVRAVRPGGGTGSLQVEG